MLRSNEKEKHDLIGPCHLLSCLRLVSNVEIWNVQVLMSALSCVCYCFRRADRLLRRFVLICESGQSRSLNQSFHFEKSDFSVSA